MSDQAVLLLRKQLKGASKRDGLAIARACGALDVREATMTKTMTKTSVDAIARCDRRRRGRDD